MEEKCRISVSLVVSFKKMKKKFWHRWWLYNNVNNVNVLYPSRMDG